MTDLDISGVNVCLNTVTGPKLQYINSRSSTCVDQKVSNGLELDTASESQICASLGLASPCSLPCEQGQVVSLFQAMSSIIILQTIESNRIHSRI